MPLSKAKRPKSKAAPPPPPPRQLRVRVLEFSRIDENILHYYTLAQNNRRLGFKVSDVEAEGWLIRELGFRGVWGGLGHGRRCPSLDVKSWNFSPLSGLSRL